MDSLIKRFDSFPDKDLILTDRGIAYQKEMKPIAYNGEYFDKCRGYENTDISDSIHQGRVELVKKYHNGKVLDIGIGSGEFIRQHGNASGYDINPKAVEWLKEKECYSESFDLFTAFTFWDVIEHVAIPSSYFKRIPKYSHVFFSIPVFDDLKKIRKSKHYRPNEHLYYFTQKGFIDYLALYGFRLLETSFHETDAGRESILSFVVKKDLPDYHDYVSLYKELHLSRFYGASSWLYLKEITEAVKWLNPASILDYGCGRSDLVAHYYLDGERKIARFDPAINEYNILPQDKFDLVLCIDVMEHIPMREIDRVFREIQSKSRRVVFVISTKLARAKLPDGQNAHVTILTKPEWIRWIEDYFGEFKPIKTQWEHVLMGRTFG